MPREIPTTISRGQSGTYPKYPKEVFRSRVIHYSLQAVPFRQSFHRGKFRVYYCRDSL